MGDPCRVPLVEISRVFFLFGVLLETHYLWIKWVGYSIGFSFDFPIDMSWILLNYWPKLLVFRLDPYKSSSQVGLGTFRHSSSPFPSSINFFVTNAFLDTCCFYSIILKEGLDMHELVFFSWNESLAWFVSPTLRVPMHANVGSINGFMEDHAQMHKMQNCSIRYIPTHKQMIFKICILQKQC